MQHCFTAVAHSLHVEDYVMSSPMLGGGGGGGGIV